MASLVLRTVKAVEGGPTIVEEVVRRKSRVAALQVRSST